MIDNLVLLDFSDLSHIRCHTRVYFRFKWDLRIFMGRMIVSTYKIHTKTRTRSWFYYDPSMEPSLSHSVKPTFLGIRMSSYFPFWGMPFWSVSLIQLWIWIIGITHLMMVDFMLSDFSTYHISDVKLWHISISVESCRSSWCYMITPTYGMRTETRTCSLFYHDPLVESLLSHPVKLVFFSIFMSSCFLFWDAFP